MRRNVLFQASNSKLISVSIVNETQKWTTHVVSCFQNCMLVIFSKSSKPHLHLYTEQKSGNFPAKVDWSCLKWYFASTWFFGEADSRTTFSHEIMLENRPNILEFFLLKTLPHLWLFYNKNSSISTMQLCFSYILSQL